MHTRLRIHGVTLRQKAFVDEYVRNGGNGAAAWRKVYRSDYHYRNAAAQSAYMALNRPSVQRYLERKLKRMIKRGQITEEAILTKYEDAFTLAKSQAKPSEMIAAATAQAKLVGLLRERVEAGRPGDFANMEDAAEVLAQLKEEIGQEAAEKIAAALGYDMPKSEPEAIPAPEPEQTRESLEDAIALFEADSPSESVN